MDTILRDDVSRKRLGRSDDVSGRIEYSCRRIINNARVGREISVTFRRQWNAWQRRKRLALAQAFPVNHEEESVFAVDKPR